MKVRESFIGNSSSSSFVIRRNKLTAKQLEQLKNHIKLGAEMKIFCATPTEEWCIRECGVLIRGSTDMDNFDIYEFMQYIGIDLKDVKIDEM